MGGRFMMSIKQRAPKIENYKARFSTVQDHKDKGKEFIIHI